MTLAQPLYGVPYPYPQPQPPRPMPPRPPIFPPGGWNPFPPGFPFPPGGNPIQPGFPFPPMPDFPPGFPFPEPPISQPIEPPVRSLYAAPTAPAGGISITGTAQQLDVIANQTEQRFYIS